MCADSITQKIQNMQAKNDLSSFVGHLYLYLYMYFLYLYINGSNEQSNVCRVQDSPLVRTISHSHSHRSSHFELPLNAQYAILPKRLFSSWGTSLYTQKTKMNKNMYKLFKGGLT